MDSGADGDLRLTSTSFDLSADLSGSRSVPDGMAWPMTSSLLTGASSFDLAEDAGGLEPGDELLLIDLQGDPSDYAAMGSHELLRVVAVSGGTVQTTALQNDYDGINHAVAAQHVPTSPT